MQILVSALVGVRVLQDYCGPGRIELLIHWPEHLPHVIERGRIQVARTDPKLEVEVLPLRNLEQSRKARPLSRLAWSDLFVFKVA